MTRCSLIPSGDGLVVDEDGMRRSQRARRAPLEYWRNEKVEYGRDHRSEWGRRRGGGCCGLQQEGLYV
jgi:hypothetical protein